jgi:antibiotic biosynthesis monooxygenase (ABM) superfamily enzyme
LLESEAAAVWILLTYVFLPIVAILVLNWLFKRSMR